MCAKLLLQVGDYFLHDGIDLLVVERLLVVLQRHAHGIRLLARLKVLALVDIEESHALEQTFLRVADYGLNVGKRSGSVDEQRKVFFNAIFTNAFQLSSAK